MPYAIKRKGKCSSVVNEETGKVHSKCSSPAKAEKQERLLRAVDHGWKPTRTKKLLAPTVGSTEGGMLGPGAQPAVIDHIHQRSNVISTLPTVEHPAGGAIASVPKRPFNRFLEQDHPAMRSHPPYLPSLDQS
jgi:hypothetical protein